ncbi:AMP-binding protein [Micromonospora sp. M12]
MPFTTVQQMFAAQASRTPHAVAVVAGDRTLTYRELDERANGLAHRLIAAGVRPGQPVAVLTGRTADLPVALLAVLKAGAWYLPLHAAYPVERMRWILDQAGGPVLLADAGTRDRACRRAAGCCSSTRNRADRGSTRPCPPTRRIWRTPCTPRGRRATRRWASRSVR